MRAWQIGIVGGGPGGLMTAYFLQKWANDPHRVTLFEASHRLGGKILMPSFQTVAATYEAGAAEIYDYSHIGDSLGIPTAIPGLKVGAKMHLQGEWITKARATSHGGRKLSVLHFTHHPLGFTCTPAKCFS